MAEDDSKNLRRPRSKRPGSQSLGPIIISREINNTSKIRRCKSNEAACGRCMQSESTRRGASARSQTICLSNIDAKGTGGEEAEQDIREILETIITAAVDQGENPGLEDAVRQLEVSESSESKEDETELHQAVKRCIQLLQKNDAQEKKVAFLLKRMDVLNAKKCFQRIKLDITVKSRIIRKVNGEIRWCRVQLREVRKFTTKFEKEALKLLEQISEFEKESLARFTAEKTNMNRKDEKIDTKNKNTGAHCGESVERL